MSRRHTLVQSVGILGVTIAGVAGLALGLANLLAADPPSADPTATAAPTFDIAVAPEAAGGRLEIGGDRTGTMALSSLRSHAEYMPSGPNDFELVLGDAWLEGPDGRVRFSRGAAEGITQLEYDGLSFYLDPGDCTITPGKRNDSLGLTSARIECEAISDIRGGGTISVAGIVALPADLFGRGDLPPSGGSVAVGSETLEVPDATVLIGQGVIAESGLHQFGLGDGEESRYLVMTYNAETGDYALSDLQLGRDAFSVVDPPCPVDTEPLGTLSPTVTVVRFTFDCVDVALPGGGTGSVAGTVVADIIQDAP